ncbi:hypothetical protein BHE74_00052933 [Ensete ventricosum]|nr:hypothetical protein BHE74_00052933 [Ensete ventricosum]
MDPFLSGRGAEPVFRDKEGKRISKEEMLKTQEEKKPKVPLYISWFHCRRTSPMLPPSPMDSSEGLAQKREAEANAKELELEREKPFARTSWLKRGIDFPPNRYGMKPGRHWDGVDRSNANQVYIVLILWVIEGFEKESIKRQNEKRATEREAYLWSVSDM